MSDRGQELKAEIKRCPGGWQWRIYGDVPYEFLDGPYKYYNPTGETFTRWGARAEARRKLKQIRKFLAEEPEVIR